MASAYWDSEGTIVSSYLQRGQTTYGLYYATEAVKEKRQGGSVQVDRSPTGSGVTARIALQYFKGHIGLGQSRTFESGATGSVFTAKAVQEVTCGEFKAVVVEVGGKAFYTGCNTFTLEREDTLGHGFLVQ